MYLLELHYLQRRPGLIGELVPVARVLPAVRRDLVRAADAARRQDDGFRPEQTKTAAFAVVGERAGDSIAILEQGDDGDFHVHVDALMNAVVLERANQFEAGAITDVREAWVAMAAEVSLKDA